MTDTGRQGDALKGRLALITGAGRGIGRETALAFAARGARLLLTDISAPELDTIQSEAIALGAEVHTWLVDVSDREQMTRLADEVHERFGPLDVLVNNAGVALMGRFEDNRLDDIEWMLDINIRGVVYACALFLPKMVAKSGCASVVNVASAAAFGAVPQLAAYAMSKAAVLSLSESLRAEHSAADLHVAVICPGFAATHIASSGRYAEGLDEPARGEAARRLALHGRHPSVVARRIVRSIDRRTFLVPIFFESWFALQMRRLPEPIACWIRPASGWIANRYFALDKIASE